MTGGSDELASLLTLAVECHRSGRVDEAVALYTNVLRRAPHHAGAQHNLGVIAAVRNDHTAAVARFDAALAAVPDYLPALLHRGHSRRALGQWAAAAADYTQVVRLEPAHYDAQRALAFLWLALSHRGRSLDHFARTAELRRGEDRLGLARRSLTQATRDKLRHDAAQFRYLAALGRNKPFFEDMARRYETVAADFPERATELSAAQRELLGDDYNTAIYRVDAPEIAAGAVTAPPNPMAIAALLADATPDIVVWDDLLTPAALRLLRDYLLRSTIWHDFSHINGFVAAYLEDGLACPLMLQIADEVRRALPAILAEKPLTQAWAFKGLRRSAAIAAHADDGVVSVNFWVTPDSANRHPEGGGLAICLTPPPVTTLRDYGADAPVAAQFMAAHARTVRLIPYRANRAVVFPSRLIHGSQPTDLVDGYGNHRINITLLYGDRTAT